MKQAGSKAAFRQVDYDFVLAAAQCAKRFAAKRFIWISAVASSSKSPSFHLRIKGDVDNSIAALKLPWFKAVQPSLLLGERKRFRLGEAVAGKVFPIVGKCLLHGPLKQFRAISAADVAQTMLALANDEPRHEYLAVWP